MSDFAGSKTQRANKYAGLRAPQTPPPGLQPGLHRKTTFCLSASPAGNTVTSNILRQPVSSFPAPAGQHIPPHVFLYQPHSLPPAHNLHSGNTFPFSSLFFLPLPHSMQQKKGNRLRRFPSLFLFFLQLQPKHLLRNLFHCSSRRPISILFCTGHAVVIHECHQVTRILDFSLDFGNFLFFFFF